MTGRVRHVVRQTEARVFRGVTQYAHKIKRLFEPHSQNLTVGPEKGWLVIQGGGLLRNEIKERFVALAGGPKANFVVIPTAMPDKEIDVDKLRQTFAKDYDIKHVAVLHTRNREQANSAEFVEPYDMLQAYGLPGDANGGLRMPILALL